MRQTGKQGEKTVIDMKVNQIKFEKNSQNTYVPSVARPTNETKAEVKQEKNLKFLNKQESVGGWDVALFGCAAIGLAGAVMLFKKYNQRSEARDTGGLATRAEAVEAYGYGYGRGGYLLGKYIDKDEPEWRRRLTGNGGADASTLWLKLEDRFRMTKIQSSTGSGKTTQFIVPQLLEDAKSGIFNIFSIDRKPPELAAMTGAVFQDSGYRVINFNPWIPEICWGFEPLFGATPEKIEAMVEVMIPMSHVEDTTWLYRITDRDVVRTVFRAAQHWGKTDRQLATLPGVAELLRKGPLATREAIESTRDARLIEGLSGLWTLPASDLVRLWGGLKGRFSFFIDDEMVARAFSRSDFTMRDLITPVGENPAQRTVLFVGASQSKGDRSRKIASLLTRLITIEAFNRGDEMRTHNKDWKDIVPLAMYLDERGTYYIPEDDDAMATFRSLGVAVTIALQSDQQLVKWQGREAAETSDINFNFSVVLGGCDLEYAKKISEEIGKHWVWTRSESKSRSFESMELGRKRTEGEGWRKVEELVLKPNEIMQLPDDEAIIIGRKTVSTGRKCPPVRVRLYAFYKGDLMNQAVNLSKEKFQKQYELNNRLDRNNRLRGNDQPRVLPLPMFDWNGYLTKTGSGKRSAVCD